MTREGRRSEGHRAKPSPWRFVRSSLFYGLVFVLLVFYLQGIQGSGQRDRAIPTTYTEECLSEGCDGEEVGEMYSLYAEECLSEGCAKEEVYELGGGSDGALAMMHDFQNRGFQVDRADFDGVCPFCAGTTTECYGVVLMCDDHCTFPDGSTGSPYACGGCLGLDV